MEDDVVLWWLAAGVEKSARIGVILFGKVLLGQTYPICDNFRLYCMIHFYKEICVNLSYISYSVGADLPKVFTAILDTPQQSFLAEVQSLTGSLGLLPSQLTVFYLGC